ncbi:MAG: helicase-exonuclease AddAB subunit AddB [Eubacteriaceae bacterium]|nr:helicase-exonuclease AddAB subunit AddB [Eubacteriaceae bacterium]
MIAIVAGKSKTGKTTLIHSEIKRCLDRNEDHLILIVPEQYTLEAEKELIASLDLDGLLNIEVLSFSRLIDRILNECGGAVRTVISGTGKLMILKKILKDKEDEFVAFSGMSDKKGLIEDVENVIKILRENMISPEALNDAVKSGKAETILDRKLHDINIIYDSFSRWLEKGYTDTEDKINMACEKIKESAFIRSSTIWIDGFHTYTKQIYDLISELSKNAKAVTVSVTVNFSQEDRDRELFEINQNTFEELKKISGDAPDIKFLKEISIQTKDMKHLKEEFFSYPYEKYNSDPPNIQLIQSGNVYSEMDDLCINILKMVREKGCKWKDICVIANSLEKYSFLLKRTMEEYGIPHFVDIKRPISDKPLSLYIINTLRILGYNYRYEDIFSLIKTGMAGLDTEEYEMLENYALRYGIRGRQWKEEFYKTSGEEICNLEKLNRFRNTIVQPIQRLHESIKENPTYIGIVKSLYEYMTFTDCQQKVDNLSKKLVEDGKLEYASENTQIYNVFMDLFDEIAEIFGEQKVGIAEFTSVIETGLEGIELAIIPSSVDEVMVGDIKRTRSSGIKVLFVVGVNEGILPSEGGTKGLFSSSETGILARDKELVINDDRFYHSVQERYLFSELLNKAKDQIIFSYSLADYEGSILRPSSYIKRLLEVFPEIEVKTDYQDSLEMVTNPEGTIRHMISHYRKGFDEGFVSDDAAWDAVYSWYHNNPEWKEKIETIKAAMAYTNKGSVLSKNQVKGLYSERIINSVTSLETYAQCPFRYFVRFGIKAEERKVYEISIPDIGQILHDGIHDYGKRLNEAGQEWWEITDEEITSICSEIIETSTAGFKEGVFLSTGRYKYLTDYLKRLLTRAIRTLTYQLKKGEFKIAESELGFGDGEKIPALEFDLSEDISLALAGRIDRLDVFEKDGKSYLKIIDYKTGEKNLSLTDIYYGLSLQLMVYMSVCIWYEKSKDHTALPAGVFYFKLDDPMINSRSSEVDEIASRINKILKLRGLILKDTNIIQAIDRDAQESDVINCRIKKNGDISASKGMIEGHVFDTLLNHSIKKIKEMGENIAAGDIEILPVKSGRQTACGYCLYKNICQFDQKFSDNRYALRRNMNDEEVVEKLLKGEANE